MIDLNRFSTDQTLEIWIEPQKEGVNFNTSDCELIKQGICYILTQGKQVSAVRLKSPEEQEELDFHLSRGCAYLCSIQAISPDGALQLRLIFFYGDLVRLHKLDILFSDSNAYAKKINQLNQDLELEVQGNSYHLLLQDDKDPNIFTFIGQRYMVSVSLVVDENDKDLKVCTLSSVRSNNINYFKGVRLCQGEINFLSNQNKSYISEFTSKQLDKLTSEAGSYLHAWDQYSNYEGEQLLTKARELGAIRYIKHKAVSDCRIFILEKECPQKLQIGDTLSINNTKPGYLEDVNLNWEQYIEQQEINFNEKKAKEYAERKGRQKNQDEEAQDNDKEKNKSGRSYGVVSNIVGNEIELECSGDYPPEQGFLSLSIDGDLTQMERRLKARRQIKKGESANPILGLIIEEDGVIPQFKQNSREHYEPLTPEVRTKIFKDNTITDAQLNAIDIALNTPDIALIQGPPGTGKTTVIAAIIERLNQIINPANTRGSILVSAFQHDAVENLLERLNVNSLPAVKFGGKQDKLGLQDHEKRINLWCENLSTKLKTKHPHVQEQLSFTNFQQTLKAYINIPNSEQEEMLLKAILTLPGTVLTQSITEKANTYINKLYESKNKLYGIDNVALIPFVYSLRTTADTYEDDGLYSATKAAIELNDFLEAEDRDLLLDITLPKEEDYFKKIKALKKRLLDKLLPMPVQNSPKVNQAILELVDEVENNIKKNIIRDKDCIIADFIFELENNPLGIRSAIEECTTVFAATVQQSEGREISRAKARLNSGLSNEDREPFYDTVIIDEAARASPPDLLIPMAKARKRVILVGDHKQLPHVIDENIVKSLEDGVENPASLDLLYRQSMFSYLVKRLNTLTNSDGVKRMVILDSQYRMHPILGDFISRSFYDNKVNSPLGAECFEHQLPKIEGKAAIWIDIPNSLGLEGRKGTSRCREAEAKAIVKSLKTWMSSPQGQDLSFGVISFYKAQVELIQEIAVSEGLLIRNSYGSTQLSEEYRGSKHIERLRINTVDAFQGMEFDVVLLSMVRSSIPKPDLPPARVYGHLMSKNRLCVALSRQKRALIMVGDASMVQLPLAQEAVPELKDYFQLCTNQGKVLTGVL